MAEAVLLFSRCNEREDRALRERNLSAAKLPKVECRKALRLVFWPAFFAPQLRKEKAKNSSFLSGRQAAVFLRFGDFLVAQAIAASGDLNDLSLL